jgi:hypothetical protein
MPKFSLQKIFLILIKFSDENNKISITIALQV